MRTVYNAAMTLVVASTGGMQSIKSINCPTTCSASVSAVQPMNKIRLQIDSSRRVAEIRSTGEHAEAPNACKVRYAEVLSGRIAMLGFAASLVGEVVTGKGVLGQIGYETQAIGVQVDAFVVLVIAANIIAALLPASGVLGDDPVHTASQEPSVGPAADAATQNGAAGQPKAKKPFFGFTKENELFVGRVAQLGFAASLLGELITGKGPLGQFDLETGLPLQDTELGLLLWVSFFFVFAGVNDGNGDVADEDVL